MERFKEWLIKEAKEESMEVKVHFIKNDYTARAKSNPLWTLRISHRVGTIEIPKDFFTSEKPKFTDKERMAVGLHELGHLKTLKLFGLIGIFRKQRKKQTWFESKADAYAKKRGFGKYLVSWIKKSRKLKEKWQGESWWWRRKIWWRKINLSHLYPEFDKRIERLLDC